jgi:hypothetical protein
MLSLLLIQVYTITVSALCTMFVLRCLVLFIWAHYIRTLFLKYIYYPFAIQRYRFVGPISRFHFLLEIGYWTLTAVAASLRFSTLGQFGKNLGSLATVQLIPLFLGGTFDLASDVTKVSTRVLETVHRSLGRLIISLGILHALISGSQTPGFSWNSQLWLFGIIV